MNVLLDTSAVIATELALDPREATAISVITIGELQAGTIRATEPSLRAARHARLAAVREAYEPLPIEEQIAERYGEILAHARSARRITAATDLLIIATATATHRALRTRDERQARLAEDVGVAVLG